MTDALATTLAAEPFITTEPGGRMNVVHILPEGTEDGTPLRVRNVVHEYLPATGVLPGVNQLVVYLEFAPEPGDEADSVLDDEAKENSHPPIFLTQEEKDRLKEEAMRAYKRTYLLQGERGRLADHEAFYVSKGIEAMAAVVFERLGRHASHHLREG